MPMTAFSAAARSCSARKRIGATFEEAIRFFKKALTLDPNYSQAYACLGFAHIFDYQNRWSDDPDNSLQLAKQYAQQAVAKDTNEPLAHCVTGMAALFEKDLDRAKTEVDLALRLNPNSAIAHNLLGSIRMYLGQPLDAIPAIEQAMRLDPAFNHQFLHFLGTAYLFAGKYETAAALLRERVVLVPETDFSASRLPPRLATSGKSTRPAGYGPSSRRSTRSIRSANTSAGGRCGRRTPSASPAGSREPACRPTPPFNLSSFMRCGSGPGEKRAKVAPAVVRFGSAASHGVGLGQPLDRPSG